MTPSLATVPDPVSVSDPRPTITLLDLTTAISATGASDQDVVAAVVGLLETGRVKLIGQVLEEDLLGP